MARRLETPALSVFPIGIQQTTEGSFEQHIVMNEPQNVDDAIFRDAKDEDVSGITNLTRRVWNVFATVTEPTSPEATRFRRIVF
ncbi:hypothetical protein AU467_18720 [Mesorhizobium loti]|uniref:Uncharacterized protein n=1 Tax=Rhizobium loti TaxID=381 RepID=A0A101KU00_RHILI|nr:hypothetical protein AU467_18720 [Mesorhizobium loti]